MKTRPRRPSISSHEPEVAALVESGIERLIVQYDLGREYRVTLESAAQTFRASGRELAETGVALGLEGSLTSELVLYEQAGE